MEKSKLQQKIMKRVYYAFSVRIATHPITVHTLVLVAAGYTLGVLVHVEMVLRNLASTELADLGSKVSSIFFNADILTLIVVGVAMMTALSLPLRMPNFHLTQTQVS